MQFIQFKYQPATIYTDVGGNKIGSFDKKVRNIYYHLSSTLTYDFNSGFYLGGGLNFAYLLASRTKTSGITIQGSRTEVEWINNYQYKKFAMHIPVEIGYEWQQNALFVNYLYGLTNRNSSEVSIVEKESFLNVGYRFYILK